MRAMKRASLVGAALVLSAAAAWAQQPVGADARWQAFVGCWEPEGAMPGAVAVCVLPAGPSAVEVVTVASGKVESRERVDASGAQVPSTRDKCSGWDRAQWSPDGKRVYLHSEHTCDGVKVRSTGVMGVAATGEWLDVRGVSLAGGPADVRVRRYRELAGSAALPAELVAEVNAKAGSLARFAARANAAEPITTAAVIEAARAVDSRVLEAWLAERAQPFALDAKRLAALADAGVPESVIDMVVAVSYPKKFAVNARAREAEPRPAETPARIVDAGPMIVSRNADYCNSRGRPLWSYALIGGYDPLGGSAYCHGYSPYGWGQNTWGYGYGYYPGVIVVRVPPTDNGGTGRGGGRMVKGRGYTSDGTADGGDRTAKPRSTDSGSSTRSGSGTSSSSDRGSSGSSSSGSSSSGGEQRTAKPRTP